MSTNKINVSGNNSFLVLSLISERDMYGYEIIEELMSRSDNVFSLKAGTLYPILHGLEKKNLVKSYEDEASNGKTRKYYKITSNGKKYLHKQKLDWAEYVNSIENVIGGLSYDS